ncbi:MAG: hypothetical protein ABJK25_11505 [Halieaceae bacterium]
MQSTLPDLIVWLIVGLLAGSLAGLVIKRDKKGFGHLINLGLGLAGALLGGALFDLLQIDFGLANISVSLQDIVSAFIGALLFLAILSYAWKVYVDRNGPTNELNTTNKE